MSILFATKAWGYDSHFSTTWPMWQSRWICFFCFRKICLPYVWLPHKAGCWQGSMWHCEKRFTPGDDRPLAYCKGIDLTQLPPCRSSLRRHIKRAHYQALIWRSATENIETLILTCMAGSLQNIEIYVLTFV